MPVRVWTDSSAAIGICSRQGLGKLRHIDTHTLWVQHAVRTKRIVLCKVDGERNPADLLTKHSLTRSKLMELVSIFDCDFRGGRAASAPQTRSTPGGRTTIAEAGVNEVFEPDDLGPVILPHLVYNKEKLLELHPPLEVPEAVDGKDPLGNEDETNIMVKSGLVEVKKLVEAINEQGRKRRLREEEEDG